MKIAVVFDGPPGPESGRFLEVEDADGNSVNAGTWTEREDGTWALEVDLIALQLQLTAERLARISPWAHEQLIQGGVLPQPATRTAAAA